MATDISDIRSLVRCKVTAAAMTALGLGRVKTLRRADFSDVRQGPVESPDPTYAWIAAMSGPMPIMFMTRVRL